MFEKKEKESLPLFQLERKKGKYVGERVEKVKKGWEEEGTVKTLSF